jgi:hypothetical protein
LTFNEQRRVSDTVGNKVGQETSEQILPSQMYDAKIEIARDLISQSFKFRQNQLVLFELKPDDPFALSIKDDFVKEFDRIAVPLV